MSSSVGWKRLLAFGAGGVALLIIGGLAASAVVARVTAHGGDPGAIRLCVHAGGWVQVVGPSEACPPNFTAQDVSIEGPQGPPGADGQDGAQGPPGGVAPAGQGCPAQQFVSGFDQDGNIVCSAVLPQTQTMEDTLMGLECFDLDTGEIIPVGSFFECDGNEWDFLFAFDSSFEPPVVVFQNQTQPVEIAYSSEPYGNVDGSDVADLSFTTDFLIGPFDRVAVLRTAPGNYFKIGLLDFVGAVVTFKWEELTVP